MIWMAPKHNILLQTRLKRWKWNWIWIGLQTVSSLPTTLTCQPGRLPKRLPKKLGIDNSLTISRSKVYTLSHVHSCLRSDMSYFSYDVFKVKQRLFCNQVSTVTLKSHNLCPEITRFEVGHKWHHTLFKWFYEQITWNFQKTKSHPRPPPQPQHLYKIEPKFYEI